MVNVFAEPTEPASRSSPYRLPGFFRGGMHQLEGPKNSMWGSRDPCHGLEPEKSRLSWMHLALHLFMEKWQKWFPLKEAFSKKIKTINAFFKLLPGLADRKALWLNSFLKPPPLSSCSGSPSLLSLGFGYNLAFSEFLVAVLTNDWWSGYVKHRNPFPHRSGG